MFDEMRLSSLRRLAYRLFRRGNHRLTADLAWAYVWRLSTAGNLPAAVAGWFEARSL